jgi:integrase
MARQINKLSARTVATMKTAGRHSDGGGLYLVVDESLAKRWLFMYRQNGKRREMGLGGALTVSLHDARVIADQSRQHLRQGQDPIAKKHAERAVVREVIKQQTTFGEMALATIGRLETGFRNEKHIAQWKMTLTKYAASLWDKDVGTISSDDVLSILKPHWDRAPETASRLRGRIEKVMDAAAALQLRTGENPARWKGNLDHLLPPRRKLTRGHHAAMPYGEVPKFVKTLQEMESVSSWALEFLILTATRSNEVRGATWDEFDLQEMVWTIPKERMKAGREHRIPISKRMQEILETMQPRRTDNHIFPSIKRGLPLSDMTLTALMRRLEIKGATVHGFRSAFRDWAGEETSYPRELAEEALAHTVGDLTERAYRRGDALRKRAELMNAWERFVGFEETRT